MIDSAIKSFDADPKRRMEFNELEPRYIGKISSNKAYIATRKSLSILQFELLSVQNEI